MSLTISYTGQDDDEQDPFGYTYHVYTYFLHMETLLVVDTAK